MRQHAERTSGSLGSTSRAAGRRERAFDVILTGHSGRRQNFGSDEAASWDEWGQFLATLFGLDEHMWTEYYESAEHFHWATGGRFRGLIETPHSSHRWQSAGTTATGSYHVSECRCGAIRRYLLGGRTFADLSALV